MYTSAVLSILQAVTPATLMSFGTDILHLTFITATMHGHDSTVDPCLLGSFWQSYAEVLDDTATLPLLTLLAAFSQAALMMQTCGNMYAIHYSILSVLRQRYKSSRRSLCMHVACKARGYMQAASMCTRDSICKFPSEKHVWECRSGGRHGV